MSKDVFDPCNPLTVGKPRALTGHKHTHTAGPQWHLSLVNFPARVSHMCMGVCVRVSAARVSHRHTTRPRRASSWSKPLLAVVENPSSLVVLVIVIVATGYHNEYSSVLFDAPLSHRRCRRPTRRVFALRRPPGWSGLGEATDDAVAVLSRVVCPLTLSGCLCLFFYPILIDSLLLDSMFVTSTSSDSMCCHGAHASARAFSLRAACHRPPPR